MRLTLQQLEAHLRGAANILRGKTAGQDYKNYILSLMFYKRLCDQWEREADDAIAELERQQGRPFSEKEKAVFRKRGEHRFRIPDGSRWGDVKAASTNLGEVLTRPCVPWRTPTTSCAASSRWTGTSPCQTARASRSSRTRWSTRSSSTSMSTTCRTRAFRPMCSAAPTST